MAPPPAGAPPPWKKQENNKTTAASSSGVLSQAISTPLEHSKFLRSKSRSELVDFVHTLAASSRGRAGATTTASATLASVVAAIRALGAAVRPKDASAASSSLAQRGRFGDPAFRTWLDWLRETGAPNVVAALGADLDERCALELGAYVAGAFGDAQRLDYGTAHETSFVLFLLCANKLGAIADVDRGDVACVVFAEYVRVCRIVQRGYSLEPAGSRGAWALDDYQCLPFALGGAQHVGSTGDDGKAAGYARSNGLDEDRITQTEGDSMFFEGLAFALKVKTGAPFAETSPMLHALSTRPWEAITKIVIDYYEREVLGKFVVARHIYFSSVYAPSWREKRRRQGPRIPPEAPSKSS